MAQVTKIEADGLPDAEFRPNADGGTDVYCGPSRCLTLNPAGGHWEFTAHSAIQGPESATELDELGALVIHRD